MSQVTEMNQSSAYPILSTPVIRNGDLTYRIEVRCVGSVWQQRHVWIEDGERADTWIMASRTHGYSTDRRFGAVS